MARYVDDSLLDDTELKEHWNKNGLIINLEKFQFAQITVDFAGVEYLAIL